MRYGFKTAAALCMATPLMAAGFDAPTLCRGQMVFSNADGSSSTCDLEVTLTPTSYAIKATDIDSRQMTSDEGLCNSYLCGTCQIEFASDDGTIVDLYRFSLTPVTETTFDFSETWKDGSKGQTILSCLPI